MKHQEAAWETMPHFDAGPPDRPSPLEEEPVSQEEDSPGFAAIRRIELLGRLHRMAFRTQLQETEMSPAQVGAMRDIIHCPGMSQRELADRLHIQRATATVMLQKMEKAGYIDRRPDRTDQRISRIYPTEKALILDSENQKRLAAYFDRVLSGVDHDAFENMMASMAIFRDNLRAILREHPGAQEPTPNGVKP